MARLPRLTVPEQLHHVVQYGNDYRHIFQDEADCEVFLKWLREASRLFKVAIHAYVLMPDHIHLLLTPSDQNGLARMMQWIGRHYVPYFNRKYKREGTLWKGRYKATVLEAERYFMTCCRFVELNPVRNGIVADPSLYQWSSYLHHIGANQDAVITEHPKYWALGNTPFDREAAYKALAEQPLSTEEITQINMATTKGWLLGSKDFQISLEKKVTRRLMPLKKGRPRKNLGSTAEKID
jgi:putative transposase